MLKFSPIPSTQQTFHHWARPQPSGPGPCIFPNCLHHDMLLATPSGNVQFTPPLLLLPNAYVLTAVCVSCWAEGAVPGCGCAWTETVPCTLLSVHSHSPSYAASPSQFGLAHYEVRWLNPYFLVVFYDFLHLISVHLTCALMLAGRPRSYFLSRIAFFWYLLHPSVAPRPSDIRFCLPCLSSSSLLHSAHLSNWFNS